MATAVCNGVFAQTEVRAITLEEAVDAAVKSGNQSKLSKLNVAAQQFRYRASSKWLLPQLKFSYTATNTNSPLNAFGLKLDQARISTLDFNPLLLNDPKSRSNFSPRADLYQPIFDLEKAYRKRNARSLLSSSEFEDIREQEQVAYEAKKAYFDLWLAFESAAAREAALLTSQQILSSAQTHYQQGLVLNSDVLDAQVMVSAARRNQIAARAALLDASERLSLITGQPGAGVYRPATALQSSLPAVDTTFTISASRADFVAVEKQIEASNMQHKAFRAGGLPVINAFGNYSFNSPVPTEIGRGGYVVGMQLTWNVFNGNRLKNQAAMEQIERNGLIERLSQAKSVATASLHAASRALRDAKDEYEEAVLEEKAATQSLKIMKDRSAQGLVSTVDLSRASNQVTDALLDKSKAVYRINETQASLNFLLAGNTEK